MKQFSILGIPLGFWITLTFICGELFQPFSTDVPIQVLFIQLLGTILFISLLIHLVNKRANNGFLFKNKLILSKKQKIYLYLILISFFIIYITSSFPSFIDFYKADFKTILAATTVALSAGFFEEYLMRGYLFNLVQRILKRMRNTSYTLTITSILTSCLFGLLHLGNMNEAGSEAVYQQIFYATCLGIFFAAIKIITNTIYVGAILHFIFDLQPTILDPVDVSSWLAIIIIFLPIAIFSILFLLSIDRQHNSVLLNP